MTLRISTVAVCYSRDSVNSRVRACTSSNSRVFSMAITAWSAKVRATRSASAEGARLCAHTVEDADDVPSRRSGTATAARIPVLLVRRGAVNSGSARTSGMWTVTPSMIARP